jgi:hypothetical protein
MQKDLAEIENLSRFRPPLRREGTRETLQSIADKLATARSGRFFYLLVTSSFTMLVLPKWR